MIKGKPAKTRNPAPIRKLPLTPQEKEDARDLAIIRREIAKGGRTYSHNQLMTELGYHDLVIPVKRHRETANPKPASQHPARVGIDFGRHG